MSDLLYGIISLLHHIPVLTLPSFIAIMVNAHFPGVLRQTWFIAVMSLPLLLSPVWCICGIVRGIRRRRERFGITCAVMSAVGLLIYALIMGAAIYLMSIGA